MEFSECVILLMFGILIEHVYSEDIPQLSCIPTENCVCPDKCGFTNGLVDCTTGSSDVICVIRLCYQNDCPTGMCPLGYCLNDTHCSQCSVSDGRTVSFTTTTVETTTREIYHKPVDGPSRLFIEVAIGLAFGCLILIMVFFVLIYFHRDKCCGKSKKEKYRAKLPETTHHI